MTLKCMRLTVFGVILAGFPSAGLATSPVTSAFTYQGQLLDAGAPAEGEFDFEFRLWDAATEGTLVSGPIAMENLAVAGGLFTVELDFGASPWNGKALWLDVRVRPGDSVAKHTELTPLQPLTAAPYALGLRPGTIVAGSGGSVGVITGVNTDSNDNTSGILGSSSAASGFNFGVYGRASSPQGAAVHGFADSGSGANYGVLGWTLSNAGTGVYGLASSSSGTNYGVYGKTSSPDGTAVFGLADSASGNGIAVHGQSDSASGYAGYFTGGRNYFEGNVGIGTLDPDRPLALVGAGVEGEWLSLKDAGGDTQWYVNNLNGGLNIRKTGTSGPRLFLAVGGNVGIGTTAPSARLTLPGGPDGEVTFASGIGFKGVDALGVDFSRAGIWAVGKAGYNGELVFGTDGDGEENHAVSERMRISANGNVGIGTGAPSEKLDVQGNLNLSGNLAIGGAATLAGTLQTGNIFGNGQFLVHSGGESLSGAGVILNDQSVSTEKGWLFLEHGNFAGPAPDSSILFRYGNDGQFSNQMIIRSTGQVGIGTVEPVARLTLAGEPDGETTFESGIGFKGLDVPSEDFSRAGIWAVGTPGYNGDLVFGTDGDGQENHAVTEKMRITSDGDVYIGSGNLGVGTNAPTRPLSIKANVDGDLLSMRNAADGERWIVGIEANDLVFTDSSANEIVRFQEDGDVFIEGGRFGIGTSAPQQDVHIYSDAPGVRLEHTSGQSNFFVHCDSQGAFGIRDLSSPDEVSQLYIGTSGITSVKALEIRGGSDIAEPFNVNRSRAREEAEIQPGTVVCIDPATPGELVVSSRAYDRTVAGIISGAGGVKTGMTLQQNDSIASGEHPVALTGRVYCLVDADAAGAIQPGDLLTTSDTPGHAMRVSDHGKAAGAILGKAMSSLERGRDLVLVLVSLQ